jgi:AcrR family transcriptional regulator
MAPRSTEDSEAVRASSRARILDAARALFAERGYFSCRILDVAERAGMSAGNVYWHFDSKEAVLGAILADGFAGLEAMAAAVADEYVPARRKLEILVDRTIAFQERNAEFTTILGGLAGPGGRSFVRSLGLDTTAIEGRYRASLRLVFAEARSEGAIATAMDPDIAGTLYLGLFDGLVVAHAERWSAMPRDALRDAALRLVGYRAVR